MSEVTVARNERRRFVFGVATALAGAGAVRSLSLPKAVAADLAAAPLPVPEPIPGGLAPDIHIFLPGPREIVLPFSGLRLQGLDVEPSTITDFRGKTAAAFVVGAARGRDGIEYGLEVDIRAYSGDYVAADGSTNSGAFAIV